MLARHPVRGLTARLGASLLVCAAAAQPLWAEAVADGTGAVVLQPHDGKDTYITSVYESRDTTFLTVGGWADWYVAFIEFDLTGLPEDADCVKLRLFVESEEHGPWTNPEMSLWIVHGDWTEGMSWRENTTTATFVRDIGRAEDDDWFEINISDVYRLWMSGTLENHGLQLRPLTNHANATKFASSESPDAERRPKLVVGHCDLRTPAV